MKFNYDKAMVRRMVNRMTSICETAQHTAQTVSTMGARIHVPGVMIGAAESFRRTEASDGQRRICVIIDMSGSMGATWTNAGGCEFVQALRVLHRRDLLHVDCWLTGEGCCARLNLDKVSEEQIARLKPNCGCESYSQTMTHPKVKADMDSADVVIAWTDGQITDGDVRTAELRRAGLDVVGAAPRHPEYVRDRPEKCEVLADNVRRHFGRGWCGAGEQLVRHITNYIVNKEEV